MFLSAEFFVGVLSSENDLSPLKVRKKTIFSVHLDLLETSEVSVQTVGAGIPSAE